VPGAIRALLESSQAASHQPCKTSARSALRPAIFRMPREEIEIAVNDHGQMSESRPVRDVCAMPRPVELSRR
jgi:hypothetical protein